MQKTLSRTRYLSCVAILSAVATVLMYLEFSIPIIPSFIKFEFSETPALIASYALGPFAGVLICFFKNLLHLFGTTTAGIGELSNFILGVFLVLPAGLIYKSRKTRGTAFVGALVGSFLMAGASMITNYYVIYPVYQNFMPMEAILAAYKAICPLADNLWKALAIFNLPFTFVKGIVDTIVTFLLYKFLSPIIKGYHLPKRKKAIDSATKEKQSNIIHAQQNIESSTSADKNVCDKTIVAENIAEVKDSVDITNAADSIVANTAKVENITQTNNCLQAKTVDNAIETPTVGENGFVQENK
ncbi:MAG: ECF transporter S component [Clostridia bacterium]